MNIRVKILVFFPYVFIFFMSLFVFVLPISGDELWNYNFARNICDEKIPYVDFNMLITPLSAYISAAFLRLFGLDLWVFRILGVLLFMGTFSLMYYICKEISKEKWLSFIATICVASWMLVVWIYNYNNLNLLLILMVIYLEVCPKKKMTGCWNLVRELFVGCLFGIIFVIKQTTGIALLAANVLICLYDIFFMKKSKIVASLRFIVSIIPAIIFFVYCFVIGNFEEFYDYTVLGVGAFSHLISIVEFMQKYIFFWIVGMFPFIVIMYSVKKLIKENGNKSTREHLVVLIISIMGGVVAYPLTDAAHMFVAIAPYVICFFFCIKYKASKLDDVCCIVGAVLLGIIFNMSMLPNRESDKVCELPYLNGVPINIELEKNIKIVDEYIVQKEAEGIKVLIADDNAAAYMIPLGRYNKNFDMLNLGNLGTKTVNDLLAQEKNTIYLVRRDESDYGKHSQVHLELIHTIKCEFRKIDEVEQFDAYIEAK